MKKTLLIISTILFSNLMIAQTTTIPDVNFEQKLINMGYDSGSPDGVVNQPPILHQKIKQQYHQKF
jgi:hypothetical protein